LGGAVNIIRIAGVGVLLFVACGESPVVDHLHFVTAADAIEIYDAYAPAPAAPDVGSVYFTIVNTGSYADTLIGIETSTGGQATLHEMVAEAESMVMHATGPVAIAPHDTLRLAPGGFHVMVTGLSKPPKVGDTIAVALSFARTGRIDFSVPVLTYTDVVRHLEHAGGNEH
jgi:copper(I)-binding protein